MAWPTHAHADALVALMAPKDIAAFQALGTGDPAATIKWGIDMSRYAWTALEGDEPLCVGGVVASPPDRDLATSGVGRPWMVSQPGLERHKRRFLRESRIQLAIIRRHFPVLTNFVSCDYPKSLRWLEWLGFEIGYAEVVAGAHVRRVSLA